MAKKKEQLLNSMIMCEFCGCDDSIHYPGCPNR